MTPLLAVAALAGLLSAAPAQAASIGTYDQCSNDQGTGFGPPDTGCRWINGNLQSNNSTYNEGDATVQRLWVDGLVPGITHTVTLKYGTTKGGSHAYDFLTTWDYSEDWITDADRCQGITGCESALDNTLAIPADPYLAGLPFAVDTAADPREFVMRGGTLSSATAPAIVSGTYAGDSETVITLTFTVGPSTGSMCSTKSGVTTCGVALWFGAHVSSTAQWYAYNGTTGAGGISGSPYHVALDALDGASVGSRDNQMQSGAVQPNGTIVIIKDAIPNDAQDFNFNLNNSTTITQDFSLDDDADPTLPNSQTFSVPPGTWMATELGPLPAGWSLTNLTCIVSGSGGSTSSVSGAQATITLESSDTVTCTYTNTLNRCLNVTCTDTACANYECNPTNGLCEVNSYVPATTICRASAGICDVAESCTGSSADCPADAFVAATTTCRESAGQCDVAESCTGTSGACPADGFQPSTTACQIPPDGDCYLPDSCDGSGGCVAGADQCLFPSPSIEPTRTTCSTYLQGTGGLAQVQYSRKGSQPITSTNPGVFFLYDAFKLLSTGSIVVTETNSTPYQAWSKRLSVQGAADGKPQVILYTAACDVVYNWSNGQTFPGVSLMLGTGASLGNVTITGVPADSYILSVKYNADVSGCSTTDCPDKGTTYRFGVIAGGYDTGDDAIPYVKKK